MNKRLFVGNLSFEVSEEQLQQAFAPYGATAATIPKRWSRNIYKQDRPKGFGFVDVSVDKAGAAIKEMNGKPLDGRELEVKEATPKPELQVFGQGNRSYGGGGYGGGGRGRGGGGGRW